MLSLLPLLSLDAHATAVSTIDLEIGCVLEVIDSHLLIYVYNNGNTASGSFYVDVFLNEPDYPVPGMFSPYYVQFPSIPPGDRTAFEVSVPGIQYSWGGGWIDVLVDSDQLVYESNENNNLDSAYYETNPQAIHFGH
jgi:hypothetical protein